LDVVERVICLLAPLLKSTGGNDQMSLMMANTYTMISKVMQKNLLDNLDMMDKIAERQAAKENENDDDDDEEPEEPKMIQHSEPSILDKALPYIEKFLPLLIGGGKTGDSVSSLINAIPSVAGILRDKEGMKGLISYIDQLRGSDETDKALAALKINRADYQ